jgi:two-component system KDP operon response regulator KdpE
MTQDQTQVKTVLIIESDEQASNLLQFVLQKENFRVLAEADGRRALPVIQAESPDLLVVDLSSRRSSGPRLCRELRNWSPAPILAVCRHPEEQLIVEALDAGADGFVSLPLKPAEMVARIRALLRWRATQPQNQDVIRSGELKIDLTQRRVFVNGKAVRLTRTEFNILAFLARNHARPVSTDTILENVWGPMRGDYTQSLRVHIGHIRRKIEPDPSNPRYLITHRGGSYRLSGVVKNSESKDL